MRSRQDCVYAVYCVLFLYVYLRRAIGGGYFGRRNIFEKFQKTEKLQRTMCDIFGKTTRKSNNLTSAAVKSEFNSTITFIVTYNTKKRCFSKYNNKYQHNTMYITKITTQKKC